MWNKVSHVHVVERVEPSIEFWTKRFGFKKIVEVPEGNHIGFVALRRDQVELQFRTRSSLTQNLPGLASLPLRDTSVVTIEMSSVGEVMASLDGLDVLVPRRTTFYGNNEVVVREPGGQIVIFTAPGDEPTIHLKLPPIPKE
jgi:Glyoxalase/Bleomycin resistance protein/Dioxygenase superfamily